MQRILSSMSIMALVALALSPAAHAQDRSLSVEQASVAELKPAQAPGEDVSGHIEVMASVVNGTGIYKMGEPVDITVRLNQDAYLTVLNVDSAGVVTVLYPNRFHPDARVAGQRDLKMPGEGARIVASGTPGTELVKVIATHEPLDVTKLASFHDLGPFQSTEAGTASTLARALRTRSLSVVPAAQSLPTDTDAEPETEAEAEATPVVKPAPVPEPQPEVVNSVTAWGEAVLTLVTVSADAADDSTTVDAAPEVAPDASPDAAPADTPAIVPVAAPAEMAPAAAPAAQPTKAAVSEGAQMNAIALTSDKPRYTDGDEILLTAHAEQSCHLTLLSVGPTGNVTLLTPGSGDMRITLEAGVSENVGPFRAEGPGGIETIRALCTSQGQEMDDAETPKPGSDQVASLSRDMSIIEEVPKAVAMIAETTLKIEISAR